MLLRLIAEDFVRDPELAAVFGSYDDEPAWRTFISQYKNLMHHYVHQISNEVGHDLLGRMRRDAEDRCSKSLADSMARHIPRPQSKTSPWGWNCARAGAAFGSTSA